MKKTTFLLCLLPFCIKAEDLFSVLGQTYQTNPTLLSAQAYLRSIDENIAIAKSSWRPSLALTADATYTEQKFKDYPSEAGSMPDKYTNDSYEAGAVLSQNLFEGFKTQNSIKYAESLALAGLANLTNTEQEVLLSAAVAYVDLQKERSILDLQINQEQVLRRHLQSYEKRFEVGDLTKTDVAQAKARLQGAITDRITAEGNVQTAIANYVKIVGSQPPKNTAVNDLSKLIPQSLDTCLKITEKNNPMIILAQNNYESSQYNTDIRKGDLMPVLNLNAGFGYQHKQPIPQIKDDYDGQYASVGAKLTIPLYQGGGEYARIRQAKQLQDQAFIQIQETKRAVIKMTTEAWDIMTATKASIDSVKAQIEASKLALDGTIRESEVGSRTVLDVLNAEQEYLTYQTQLVEVNRNLLVSKLNLLSAMGKLTHQGLNLKVEKYDPLVYKDKSQNKWIGTTIK